MVFRRYLLLFLAVPAALLLSFVLFSASPLPPDFAAFWLAGSINGTGGDPYNAALWHLGEISLVDQTFLYPRTLAVLLTPLGWVRPLQAYILWNALAILALAGTLILLLSLYPDTKHYILPYCAASFLFRPFWATLKLGHLSAFLTLDLAATIWLWNRGRWFAGGVALSLLALKPNLGAPLLAGLGLWLLIRRRRDAIGGIAAGGLGLLALGWLADPGWIGKFLAIGNEKLASTFGFAPTIWGLAVYLSGFRMSIGLPLGILACLACTGLMVWHLRRIPDPVLAFTSIVALVMLITPYLWSYDQTLLLLPVIVMSLSARPRLPYLAAALAPLVFSVWAVVFQILSMHAELDLLNGLLSLAVFTWVLFILPRYRAG